MDEVLIGVAMDDEFIENLSGVISSDEEALSGSYYLQSLVIPFYEEPNEYGITARIGEDVIDLDIQ